MSLSLLLCHARWQTSIEIETDRARVCAREFCCREEWKSFHINYWEHSRKCDDGDDGNGQEASRRKWINTAIHDSNSRFRDLRQRKNWSNLSATNISPFGDHMRVCARVSVVMFCSIPLWVSRYIHVDRCKSKHQISGSRSRLST